MTDKRLHLRAPEEGRAMSKTVEALEGLLSIVNESKGVDGFHLNGDIATWDEFEEEVEAAKAALPRAELEGQAVGRLSNLVNDCLANDFNEHWDSYKRAEAILTQIAALKAKDGTGAA